MRKYKIAQYSLRREWSIFREDGDTVQWLSPENVWTKNKKRAMKFISEQDAVSALSVCKFKGLKSEEEYIEEVLAEGKEKRSWGELSAG